MGKSYLYEPSDGPLVFAGFLIRVRPIPDLLVPAFLAAYATTRPYWNWVRLMSMRSGQPGINGNEYANTSAQEEIATLALEIDQTIRECAPAGWKGDETMGKQVLNALFPVLSRDRETTMAIFELIKHQAGYA